MEAEGQAGASRLTASAPLPDIPEEEARYWAKKLEQLNAMRDQDEVSAGVWRSLSSCVCLSCHAISSTLSLFLSSFVFSYVCVSNLL